MIKKHHLIIFIALMIIGMSVAVAADTTNTDTTVQKDTTQPINLQKTYKTADTIIKANETTDTINNKKSIDKKENKDVKGYDENYTPDQSGYWVETPDNNNPFNVETHITDENKNVIFIQEQNYVNPAPDLRRTNVPYNFTYYLDTDFIYGKDLTYFAYPGNTTYNFNGKTLYEGIIFDGGKPGSRYYQPEEVIFKDLNILCDNDFFQEEINQYGWNEITRGESPQFSKLPTLIKNSSITINITEDNMHNTLSEIKVFSSSLLNKTAFENCTFNIGLPIQRERYYNDGTGTFPKIFVPVDLFGPLNITVTNCIFNVFCISDEEDITGYDVYPCFMNMTSTDNTVNFTGNTINLNNVKGFILNTNNAIIENNTITTNCDYVAEITGNNNIIKDNTFVAKELKGNDAVLVTGTDNIVENNGPVAIKESEINFPSENIELGETTSLTAVFYTEDNEPVLEGTVIFKLNDKTLRDAEGKVIYVEISEGTATLSDVNITGEWIKEGTTIQAVYLGDQIGNILTTEKTSVNVTRPEATITLDVPANVTAGETLTLTATVTDTDTPVNTGRVVFKLNGKTLKDENGKVIYVNVVNGVATTNYTIPSKTKAREYTLTAVFVDSMYKRCETEGQIVVTK